ncbi:response regulator receiver sensor signal transduction histidine kinase [Calothrix parasitica NIES-267]|uniref:histidine kinase n=1 Tax=Calothrix parasitica NIES-267 TaxID=1973488 RepID=A0A1Z4LS48_9CYAN|nr:response regulator receiver sensor signal transduction histidine kinase [Calothrix parasitica NIES-267]
MKEKILVVEDEIIIACDIKCCLESSGYNVLAVIAYGEQAIEQAEELQPDLVLMDVMLKGEMNGVQAAEIIINKLNVPVVFLTAHSDESTLIKAKATQPFGYIFKPFEETQLITTIEIALSKHQKETIMRDELQKEKEMRELKSRFVSMVSHEFRNPLSTILNSTELLANHSQEIGENKKDEYLYHIQNAVKNLNQLLSDVLLVGKAEVHQTNFNPQPLYLEKFCEDLVAELKLIATEEHQIILKIQGCSIKPQEDSAANNMTLPCLDEKLLRHILTNLLSNAVKYSPQGGKISFDLFCLQGEAIFRIQDEGIGIPEIEQDNLFNSFQRASNVGQIPGHGLGLSIVKQYVELHRGEITFVSKEGVGTTFIISLPLD